MQHIEIYESDPLAGSGDIYSGRDAKTDHYICNTYTTWTLGSKATQPQSILMHCQHLWCIYFPWDNPLLDMTLDDNHRSNTNSHECLHTYCSTVCGCSGSKVQYTTENWISHLTNYCMLSWRSPTNRDWTAILLAHVCQSSMALYNWPTRSTVRRHQLYLF